MSEWILDSIKDTRLTSRDLREIDAAIAAANRHKPAEHAPRGIETAEAFARDMAARGYLIVRREALREAV